MKRTERHGTSRRNHRLCSLHELDLIRLELGHGRHLGRRPIQPQRRGSVADKVEAGEDGLGGMENTFEKGDVGVFALPGDISMSSVLKAEKRAKAYGHRVCPGMVG